MLNKPRKTAWVCVQSTVAVLLLQLAGAAFGAAQPQLSDSRPRSASYQAVQRRLGRGWNTWEAQSVTTHVSLPDGLAIRVGIHHQTTLYGDAFLPDALIGRQAPGAEIVFPGPHSWDGSYTDLKLSWRDHNLRIQSAHDGDDLVLLVTPLPSEHPSALPPSAVFSVGFLWNSPGTVSQAGQTMEARGPSGVVPIYFAGKSAALRDLPVIGPYYAGSLSEPAAISTGKPRSVAQIHDIIERQSQAYRQSVAAAGPNASVFEAIETTLGWDTIYEPEHRRVVSPVSRVWCVNWGGYVIFDWDTFFGASMAAIGDRDLAYADALETLRELTPAGFVPNAARTGDWKSFDRSEPPVGAITLLDLYRRFKDRWVLEDAFEPLLRWNRWWSQERDVGGYLVWGSDGGNKPENVDDLSRGTRQGAIYESGLDNSPMYDDATFDQKSQRLLMADVGLLSMYIADCDALAEIADVLAKTTEAAELRGRSERYRSRLATLWDEKSGIFLNKNLSTGQPSLRISPTNLYPLLARAATPEQARRMVGGHLLNPAEFWGTWVIPATPRNDTAFHDQNYWRGRIWGPMNYLVYLGMRKYDLPLPRKELAQRSYDLFEREWKKKGHLHENYNALTGEGDDVTSSDRFYHWGALLGLIQYIEETEPVTPVTAK